MSRKIFKVSKHFTKVTVWESDSRGEFVGAHTRTPLKGLTLDERVREVQDFLQKHGFKHKPRGLSRELSK